MRGRRRRRPGGRGGCASSGGRRARCPWVRVIGAGHRVTPGIVEVFRAVGKGEPGLEGVLQGRVRECHLLGNRAPAACYKPNPHSTDAHSLESVAGAKFGTSPTRTARLRTKNQGLKMRT